LLIPLQAFAASSTLFLSPSSVSKIWPNNTFSVQVLESSGTTSINAVLAKLSYPTAMLTCSGISVSGSAFVIPNSDSVNFGNLTSCSGGAITIVEGTTGTGFSGSNKLVATINFKVNAAATLGSAAVNFLSGSAVVNGSTNTDDLSSSTGGTYTVCKVADLNCDGTVNYLDASIFIGVYGTTNASGDFNSDGTVNYLDASIFIGKYGT
jgi:hypothetical protein